MIVNSTSSVFASIAAMIASYPFDGARLYRQKYGKYLHNNMLKKVQKRSDDNYTTGGNYSFWHGFLKALHPSGANVKSLATAILRVPLATAFSHTLYLFLQNK